MRRDLLSIKKYHKENCDLLEMIKKEVPATDQNCLTALSQIVKINVSLGMIIEVYERAQNRIDSIVEGVIKNVMQ